MSKPKNPDSYWPLRIMGWLFLVAMWVVHFWLIAPEFENKWKAFLLVLVVTFCYGMAIGLHEEAKKQVSE